MRELDLMLERFLGDHLEQLSERELEALERLLEHADDDILAWLLGRQPAPDAALARLVARILGDGGARP